MKSKKAKLTDTETRSSCQGAGGGEMGGAGQSYKIPVIRGITSGDLMCSVVTLVSNTVLNT